MRKIVNVQPSFFINLEKGTKIVDDYREKYNKISNQLDANPDILSTVHKDLREFGSYHGKGSKFSTEQVLRMLIIMFVEQLTYRDTIIRVTDSAFLRNFSRIGIGKVMSHPFLCAAFKHISPDTWKAINALHLQVTLEDGKISGEKLRLDSTVCESNIHYPTDAFLLWDTYRVIARLIRQCNEAEPLFDMKNRFHDGKIKKLYTYISTHISKKNKSTKRQVLKKMRILIDRVGKLCETANRYISRNKRIVTKNDCALELLDSLVHYYTLGTEVFNQSYRVHILKEKVPASERIFSIFEEHTELLKRGKAGKPIEFGHMVSIGQTGEKFISYYDIREKSLHDIKIKELALEDHKERFSEYPSAFAADKNYYESTSDISSWEDKIDVYGIAKKGKKNALEAARESSEEFTAAQRFRAGVEGSISVLKRVFGLRRCFFKGFKSFAASVGCLVFCHNIVLLTRM